MLTTIRAGYSTLELVLDGTKNDIIVMYDSHVQPGFCFQPKFDFYGNVGLGVTRSSPEIFLHPSFVRKK